MRICIIAFLALFAASGAIGQDLIDIDIISKIESNDNPLAYNHTDGGSTGQYQIAPICMRAFNAAHGTNYRVVDLYNPTINKTIALWALNEEIPRMLKKYGFKVNKRNVIIAYNAGISYVVKKRPLPLITRQYLAKYDSLVLSKAKHEHP